MSEAEVISTLVGGLYDAALDPALWPAALRRTGSFVGGSAVSVYAKDTARRDVQIYHDDGSMDLGWVKRYAETYVRVDPSTTRHFFLGVEEAASTSDVMPIAEFQDTQFSAEWAAPQNLIDGLTAMLDKSGTRLGLFTVFRDRRDGMVDGAMRRRMQLVIPHVRRAVLVAGLLQETSDRALSLADTLDAVDAAVFLLAEDRGIVHVNAAGRALLAAGTLVVASAGHLIGQVPEIDRALAAGLAFPVVDDPVAKRVAVPLSGRDGELFLAHMLPLGAVGREAGFGSAAVAALFIRRATLGGISAAEALAKTYRLTPSELRTLLAIVEIGGVREVGDTLGIAESTVKFHLRRLFEKTGMHRQADLVKLAAGFSSSRIR
ncbi:MAG: helix-turn-helix transcriptional regulator [Devosia sp.]